MYLCKESYTIFELTITCVNALGLEQYTLRTKTPTILHISQDDRKNTQALGLGHSLLLLMLIEEHHAIEWTLKEQAS